MKDFSSEDKSPEYFYVGLYVLVGAGALMMAVGFFGCCGAMRESQCVLGSFFTCLLVIFAAEVTTGVFAFIGKGVVSKARSPFFLWWLKGSLCGPEHEDVDALDDVTKLNSPRDYCFRRTF